MSTRANRLLTVAVLVVAAVAIVATLSSDDADDLGAGCAGVANAHQRVTDVETDRDLPTAAEYTSTARVVRTVAVDAPAEVAVDLHLLADSYGQLGTLFRGFEPDDPATYHVVEQRAADIERQQSQVDRAASAVGDWLETNC